MTVLAVFNQKGGVGKTTTVLNLAAGMARRGRAPACIDLDPQAQLSAAMGVLAQQGDESVYGLFQRNRTLSELRKTSPNGISIVPAHIELAKVETLYGKGYNAINKLNASFQTERAAGVDTTWIIDCCPLVGVLSLNAIFASDGVLVPISADYLSMKGAVQISKTLHALEQVLKRRVPRRYLVTRFDKRRGMSADILQTARQTFGADVCETVIAENVSLAQSPSQQMNIFEFAPSSHGAQDYEALLAELLADGFIKSA
ncbi:MAG: ParA family protein [Gallionella sp.]